MTAILLPYAVPIIKGYQNFAFPLSVSFVNDEFVPWFYSHFIQLRCRKNYLEPFKLSPPQLRLNFIGHTFFENYPNLDIIAIDKDEYRSIRTCIIDYLEKCIEKGFYVKTNWDEYYIFDRKSHQKNHFDHDVLVYGFDNKEEVIYTLGYNSHMQYGTSKIPYKVFEQAHTGTKMILLKNKRDWKSSFDLECTVDLLCQYINSQDSSIIDNNSDESDHQFAYGMNTYQYITKYLESVINGEIWSDIRVLYILWEHKKCMLSRLQYMQAFYDAAKHTMVAYSEVEKKAQILLNLFIKAEIIAAQDRVKSHEIIRTIMKGINELATIEKPILYRLTGELQTTALL